MQLLIEEFFKKILNFINDFNFVTRSILKIFFYFILIGILAVLIILFFTKKGWISLLVMGLYIIGEVVHFIRKSMERKIISKRY